jgi:hypothetical protein
MYVKFEDMSNSNNSMNCIFEGLAMHLKSSVVHEGIGLNLDILVILLGT